MDYVKIGKFIASMRRERGMTQRDFADLMGISDKTVSKWECGNGMPEVSLMPLLCDALGINLNELFSGERLDDASYKKKAEENMIRLLKEDTLLKSNIVGGDVLGQARNVPLTTSTVHTVNNAFWSTIGSEALGVTALPSWGGYMTEEKLHLLGDMTGKRALEIGCGNGRSLKYVHDRGASEVWGIDLSPEQIQRTRVFLSSQGVQAHLLCAPMEEDCGIPTDYFDVVYSVFGIGWTTDLDATFQRIHTYLKPGGRLLFNWSHPIHKCTQLAEGRLIFCNRYFDEGWYAAQIGGGEIMLSNRMMSTYINALAASGFRIERLIEEGDHEALCSDQSDFAQKARIAPVGFVLQARKEGGARRA